MANTKDLIFLTGASGFLGYLTLIQLLKKGYHVRAAVRSQAKAAKIEAAPSFKALAAQKTFTPVDWVIIPDMTVPGAYDDAVKGATSIIHIASPIPSFGAEPIPPSQLDDFFVRQPLAATIGLLDAAAQAGTVKRIVKTSSIVAIVPFEYYLGQGADYATPFPAEHRIPDPEGPYAFEFQAYSAGKARALNAAEQWMRDRKDSVSFDLVTIFPGWIFGRDELVTDAATLRAGSTNSVLLGLLLGGKYPNPSNSNVVSADDAARMHADAIDARMVPSAGPGGHESFLAAVDFEWNDANGIMKRSFPEAVKAGKLSGEGDQPTIMIKNPIGRTEEVFGFKLKGYDAIVESVAGQYLELLDKAQ